MPFDAREYGNARQVAKTNAQSLRDVLRNVDELAGTLQGNAQQFDSQVTELKGSGLYAHMTRLRTEILG